MSPTPNDRVDRGRPARADGSGPVKAAPAHLAVSNSSLGFENFSAPLLTAGFEDRDRLDVHYDFIVHFLFDVPDDCTTDFWLGGGIDPNPPTTGSTDSSHIDPALVAATGATRFGGLGYLPFTQCTPLSHYGPVLATCVDLCNSPTSQASCIILTPGRWQGHTFPLSEVGVEVPGVHTDEVRKDQEFSCDCGAPRDGCNPKSSDPSLGGGGVIPQ